MQWNKLLRENVYYILNFEQYSNINFKSEQLCIILLSMSYYFSSNLLHHNLSSQFLIWKTWELSHFGFLYFLVLLLSKACCLQSLVKDWMCAEGSNFVLCNYKDLTGKWCDSITSGYGNQFSFKHWDHFCQIFTLLKQDNKNFYYLSNFNLATGVNVIFQMFLYFMIQKMSSQIIYGK